MTLRDWIDELSEVLEIDVEVDEGLVLDLARDAAHNVERPAAPLTTYLLGYAAAQHRAGPARLEDLAAAATELAESWSGEADDSAEQDDDGVADDEDQIEVD